MNNFFHFLHFGVRLLSGIFEKKAQTHVALCGNISAPVSVTDLVEASKDAASLLVCTRKKFFAWGAGFFVSEVTSGRLLCHLAWPWALTVRW